MIKTEDQFYVGNFFITLPRTSQANYPFFLHKNHLTEKDYYTQELTCCYQES